jgi:hypothetical protein
MKYRVYITLCALAIYSFLICCSKERTMGQDRPTSRSLASTRPDYPFSTATSRPHPPRHLSDLQFNRALTKEKTSDSWGPPDATFGSGVEYSVYELADGTSLTLRFESRAPHELMSAVLNDIQKQNSTILFMQGETVAPPTTNPGS